MKIAVCITQVPETEAKINICPDEKTIDFAGINFILNPYDEYAVEEAIKNKEKNGGTICIISLGNEKTKEVMRKALAMGCDSGVLLKTDNYFDSLSLAKNLAAEIICQQADIVFFGRQAVDFENSITGKLTAEILGYNYVSSVVKLEINDKFIKAEREIEEGREIVETSIPVVITAQKGLNEPRYATLKGIMASKKIVIEEKSPVKPGNKVEILKFIKPVVKPAGRILGTDKSSVPELVRILKEKVKLIKE